MPKAVKDLELTEKSSVDDIMRQMESTGGFTGRHLAEAVELLHRIVTDRGSVRFLSFPAAIIATGLRGVIRSLIDRKLFDVIITTTGTLDHDLARSWNSYFEGSFQLDDRELWRQGKHRLGNIVIPKSAYGPALEAKLQPFFKELYDEGIRSISPSEINRKMGEKLASSTSILAAAARVGCSVLIPGFFDGAVGNQFWLFTQSHKAMKLDESRDQSLLAELVYKAKRSGALIIGGGISKHHTLWWNQFKGGLDSAVYLTTADEWDGSLSGAEMREAVSWGKVKRKGRHVTIHGEATALLPFMAVALMQRLHRH